MTSRKNRTRQEMEEEMRQLRKVFMTVRLMKADEVQGGKKGSAPCYVQWRRSRPCENCVARQALEKNTRKTRLEYFGQELYEITASCVQVDGQLCVLELTRKIDRSVLLDPENGERLLNSITDEREKRYRDPLTGAYNRTYYDENYRYRSITAGVAMLDMDDLKFSNDVYGSGAGNSVLETAVSTIRRGLSEKDRLIRYDGGRLLLLLPDIRQEQLSPRLEQIRLQLQAASVPGYSRIRMSASIGGVWIDDENVDDAVQHAERLMHYARIQKNTVITERQPEPHALQPTHSRQSVLIVDDSAMNRMLLSQMLNSQFDTAEAASGEDCLRLLEQNPTGISVVLLDIHMTGIDGFTVLEAMSQRGMLEEIPVIMISSEDNVDTVRRAFDLGASDYISRPFDARVVYQRITNTIRMYAKQRRLSAMVADQVSQKEKRSQMMIGILSRVVERRNGESRTHVQHISTLTGMLLDHLVQKTETYPLTQEMRRTISMASVLHDIGKMEIGEQVLNSPEPRTPEDEETMRQHTLLGARMLEELDAYRDEDFVRVAYQICRWHHERYDGSGYPDQLVGEQIPIAAQVVGLADAYETLTTGSGSQSPVPCAAAVQMLCTGEAGAFNPVLLDCLREIENEIDDAMRRRPETL